MDYFISLTDKQVPKKYQTDLKKWRVQAKKMNYIENICWQVKAGFTVKQSAPELGNCYKNFQYIQGWNFSDEPTKDCFVFWIPQIVPESLNKNTEQQKQLLEKFKLPHINGFGSIQLLIGLILYHYNRTKERVPLDYNWIRSDTLREGGFRLVAGSFDEDGLYCGYWDEGADGHIGFFLLGVALGNLEPLALVSPDTRSLGISDIKISIYGKEYKLTEV